MDGNGHTTSYSYDTAGNPTTITAPAPLGTSTYSYDAAGRQTSKTDGRGTTTYTSYDALDRITQLSSSASSCPIGTCVSYTYNAEGWLTQRVDASGTTSYSYDVQGRALTKNLSGGPTGGNTSQTYDGNGNLVSYTDDGGTVGYRYDAANRVVALWEPGGSCPTTPAYPNSTKCIGFGYDNANHRTSVSYPNGQTIAVGYDHSGRETSVVAKNSASTTLASRSYSYLGGAADTDLRQSATDQAGTTTSYTYDPMNRLLSATGGSLTQSWTYDHNGNRLSDTTNGSTTYSAFNAGDELCNTATTSGGSCTAPATGATAFTYNGSGDLTGGGALSSATYSTFDQTVTAATAAGSPSYVYSDLASDERTYDGTNGFVNGILGMTYQANGRNVVSFVRDPNGVLIAAKSGSSDYYYTTDAVGSTILITDGTGATAATYSYDPWGGHVSSSGSFAGVNPYRYAGGYSDTSTGWVKLGTRYYQPAAGRFTQQDPAGQGPNFYAYAGDNPVDQTDPTGRFSFGDLVTYAGFALAVAGLVTDPLDGGLSTVLVVGGFELATGGATYSLGCQIEGDC